MEAQSILSNNQPTGKMNAMQTRFANIVATFVAICGSSSLAVAATAPNQYAAWYNFDEFNNGVVSADSSGNANTLTVPANSLNTGAVCHDNHCMQLTALQTATQGVVGVTPIHAPPTPQAFTMEGWANVSSSASANFLEITGVQNGNGASTSIILSLGWSGTGSYPVATLYDNVAHVKVCNTDTPAEAGRTVGIPNGQWAHYALSYDGVNLRAFLNGHSFGAKNCGAGVINFTGSSQFQIGAIQAGNLTVDEVGISSGRNEPSGCPFHYLDTGAGFCINPTENGAEASYGDALNQCAEQLSQVCTFSQVYTAMVTKTISIPAGYRVSDVMYQANTGMQYFGGNDNGVAANPLVLPATSPTTVAPGPWSLKINAGYFCCTPPR